MISRPLNLSRSEFAAIRAKAKARKDKRSEKAIVLAADRQRRDGPAASQDAPGALSDAENASPSVRTPVRRVAGKSTKRPLNRKERIKRLKKAGLVLWSLVVRKRDGNKCLMCGSVQCLNAHHWLFRKSHSVRLALDPANGATLCAYPCHLGRVHHDGDGDFILRLADKMIGIVGQLKVDEMRETARHSGPLSLEEIEPRVAALKASLGPRD